ncbi:hypothetical protein Pmani_011579 [Petrolisthes manimaculis]|uniref:Uncharacterized protein n=1 Tax=Petrolisthes manimaculis TaxID=1843537 RepID=A0AAE1UFI9_9EUCA|nr:hypothetical protein Pmani_011579 [Petrolisthes manimaculis]
MDRVLVSTAHRSVHLRAKIILLYLRGTSARSISHQTGASLTTVYRWIHRWQERPYSSILKHNSPGRQRDYVMRETGDRRHKTGDTRQLRQRDYMMEETGDKKQKGGDRRQETGDTRQLRQRDYMMQEAGDRRQETGDTRQLRQISAYMVQERDQKITTTSPVMSDSLPLSTDRREAGELVCTEPPAVKRLSSLPTTVWDIHHLSRQHEFQLRLAFLYHDQFLFCKAGIY